MELFQDTAAASAAVTTAGVRDAGSSLKKSAAVQLPSADTSLFTDTIGFIPVPAYSLPYRDTLSRSAETPAAPNRIILYGTHSLTPRHNGPLERETASQDWMFPVLFGMLAVFTALRLFYSRYFKQMVASLFNVNLSNQIVRDENILVQRATVYMSIMFYLTAALFLYFVSEHRQWELPWAGSGFPRFLKFIVVVSAVYAVKFLALRFCGWLFGLERELTAYLFTIFIINNVQGLVLFPFIVLMCYNPGIGVSWMITLCFIVIGFFYLFRLFRGLQIGLNVPGTSLLYLFLYLCTLELAPLLVMFRIAGGA